METGTGGVNAGNEYGSPLFEDEVLMTHVRESGIVDYGVSGEGGEGCLGTNGRRDLNYFVMGVVAGDFDMEFWKWDRQTGTGGANAKTRYG